MAKKDRTSPVAAPPFRFPVQPGAASASALVRQALGFLQRGDASYAEALLRQALGLDPRHFDALHLLGLSHMKRKDFRGAVSFLQQAAAVNGAFPPLYNNLGIAQRELGELAGSLASYDRALTLQPGYPEALSNRGNVLRDLGRPGDALAAYDASLAMKAENSAAWNNRGMVLLELGRHDEALASFAQAIALRPDYAEAHFNRGNALEDLQRFDEALASYERALQLQPEHVRAWNNRGGVLEELNRPEQALASYERALALQPGYAEAANNRGSALEALHRPEEALASYEQALVLDPQRVEVLANCGYLLAMLGRHADAANAFSSLLRERPKHPYAAGQRLLCQLHSCDWSGYEEQVAAIESAVHAGERASLPFTMLAISGKAAVQKRCAEIFSADRHPATALPAGAPPAIQGLPQRRLRLAYVSADLHDHATARLMADVFERHDASRFEVWAFSSGPDLAGPMRDRLKNAFEHFVDIRSWADQDVARSMRDCGIDIAVDLKGYTRDSRPGIFAFRPAPVQVSYLGYPGTSGAGYIDYLLADGVVVPPGSEGNYTECVARLPGTYQANAPRRAPATGAPERAACGLPETGFVFCCFNSVYKITPKVFDTWMRLLIQVEGSVLWLLEDSAVASGNLRREAQHRGVDPARLVFAPRTSAQAHLARHRLADLFLDTAPVNAHTTASDALWNGLPVLTCPGESFASRVAASLLTATGLPELVASDLADYETKALALARQPAMLQAFRSRLGADVESHPLGDVDLFRKQLESAFMTMALRAQEGLHPQSFDVVADGSSVDAEQAKG